MDANLDVWFAEYGTLAVIKGHTRSMDLFSATLHREKKVLFSQLNASWGFVADLDIESDQFRWIGRSKTVVSALRRWLFLRRYRAWVVAVPHPDEAADAAAAAAAKGEQAAANDVAVAVHGDPEADPTCLEACPYYAEAPPAVEHPGPHRQFAGLSMSDLLAPAGGDTAAAPMLLSTPSSQPITLLDASNMAYLGTDYRASQRQRLRSGYLDVVADPPGAAVSRSTLLRALLSGGFVDPAHPTASRSLRTRAVRICPLGLGDGDGPWPPERRGELAAKARARGTSVFSVSGEPFEMQDVTVEVHDGLVRVLAPAWLDG
ncbi:hypothetical protein HK405_002485 [Cladochytrium tenue]|nr:hypothetical protein HK405_002485 [Cladochytrium tenue]